MSQSLILEAEKSVKNIINSLNITSSYPCVTSFGNEFDETQNQIVVEADGSADEVVPNSGVYRLTMKVAVFEAAPEGNTESTASYLVFNRLCRSNISDELMVSSSNRLFVYKRPDSEPSFNNAEVGDSWQQVITFKMDCCLTTGSI